MTVVLQRPKPHTLSKPSLPLYPHPHMSLHPRLATRAPPLPSWRSSPRASATSGACDGSSASATASWRSRMRSGAVTCSRTSSPTTTLCASSPRRYTRLTERAASRHIEHPSCRGALPRVRAPSSRVPPPPFAHRCGVTVDVTFAWAFDRALPMRPHRWWAARRSTYAT